MAVKFFFCLMLLFGCYTSFSQKTVDYYYDYNWRPCAADEARFYSLSRYTDSGWFRTDSYENLKKLQMMGLYEDKETTIKNGTFYWFYPDGLLKTVGRYVHNKKEGLWMDYAEDKSLLDSMNYKDGHLSGISLSWYKNGNIRDSTNIDEKGNGIYVSWFDNSSPSCAGKYVEFDKEEGQWQYFHKNGQLSSRESYDHGDLFDKKYFGEDGKPILDTTSIDSELKFKGGDKSWSKYLAKNLFFPAGVEFKNGYQAVVVVKGTVNEEGKVIDVELIVPISKVFDKIAMDAMRDSKEWLPAIAHNRKVYGSFTEAINFSERYY